MEAAIFDWNGAEAIALSGSDAHPDARHTGVKIPHFGTIPPHEIGTLFDDLARRQLRYGLCILCVGGGMGIATIVERT